MTETAYGGPSLGFLIVITLVVLVLGSGGAVFVLEQRASNRTHMRNQENQAGARLGTFAGAQGLFRVGDKDADGLEDYGTLAELTELRLIALAPGETTLTGYAFSVTPGPDPLSTWWATAAPIEPGADGERWFYADHTGDVWESSVGPITSPLPPTAVPFEHR